MGNHMWMTRLFKPSLDPKYSLIQEQTCPRCGINETSDNKNYSRHNLKLLVLGFIAGTLVSLLVSAPAIYWYISHIRHRPNAAYYPADVVFGKIPTKAVIFEQDPAFVESDPLDGRWDGGPAVLNGNKRTPWDELYLSPWVEIPNPSSASTNGGVPLQKFSDDPAWTSSSQGFVPSVLHQLHCVGIIKHALMRFEKGDYDYNPYEDTTHCLEYLRQTLMCHGDLTLERPRFVTDKTFGGPTGWGVTHQCRDWSAIHSFISKHTVTFSGGKPILWVPQK
ncbi:hypothetical protein F5884DRAFT_760319 [Xylogone sp. PMI_703]|nr:hypothetical protein F5884DRAFT_760319 [Xylogone sp. PMI_703]